MPETSLTDHSSLLSDLSPYIYGTTRLGHNQILFEDRVNMARLALNAGVWLHTSHTYGNALEVLRTALDQAPTAAPKFIVKLIGSSRDEIEQVLRLNLEGLGLESLELGQLCLGGQLAEEFATGGACYETLSHLKDEGLVRRFVLEVFPWTSGVALNALQHGYAHNLVDGFIFYLNPIQRFASNALWDLIMERNEPIIAMRTVAGGPVHRLRDVPGVAWQPYLQERAVEVAPIYEHSGVTSWTEFCVRFAFGFSQVRATVGATSRSDNLQAFLDAADNLEPLPQDIQNELVQLQYRWSDELDIHAVPWSM